MSNNAAPARQSRQNNRPIAQHHATQHSKPRRDANGEVCYVALRDAGQLVGYFVGFVAPGLHYSTCLTCTLDIFWVHPEYRKGRSGIILFKAVESELKRRGVKRWFVGSKVH